VCGAKELLLIFELATGLIDRPALAAPQTSIKTESPIRTPSTEIPPWVELRELAKEMVQKADQWEAHDKKIRQFWELADMCQR
jgi:hypothetical protein